MKIQIIACLSEMVKVKFGEDKWNKILELSDMDTDDKYLQHMNGLDIHDNKAFELINNTCVVLNVSREEAADAFGEYWVCVYAPRVYKMYYGRYNNAKDFLMGMDFIHAEVTKNVENANPPRFEIEELEKNKIRLNYISKRNMLDFCIGLVKGIGKQFNTKLEVIKISDNSCEITFLP